MPDYAHVIATATIELSRADSSTPVDMKLFYFVGKPFTVTLGFQSMGKPVWLVSRDLLADGLLGPSGIGDIRLRPCDHDTLRLELRNITYPAFYLPSGPLRAFLESTYAIVPRGTESERLNIDAALDALLGRNV